LVLAMELRQLRYFVAIADSGSVTKAAERVFVAQSALSHQLAQLEAELGVSLFERSRRGVGLTEAGQRFFPHAVSILRQAEEAVASARSTRQEPEGTVVFGLPHSASSALALPLLREVRQRFPRVTLELTEELTGNLSRQLRTGQIQLAVLFDDGQLGGFSVTPVLSEQLCLIEPASAPRTGRRGRTLTLQQALAQPLILPASPHGVRPIIEAAAAAAGLPPPRVEADISSISILRTTLLAGLAHSALHGLSGGGRTGGGNDATALPSGALGGRAFSGWLSRVVENPGRGHRPHVFRDADPTCSATRPSPSPPLPRTVPSSGAMKPSTPP